MSQLGPFSGPIPGQRDALYDFSPFLTAPAVQTALPPLTPPSAIAIPETQIASPLAPNLAPHTLLDLQEYLCGTSQSPTGTAIAGNGRWAGPGSELGARKGREIWESWKRAWDLWNGHYIEGRMPDPAWIRQQYDKLKVQVAKETAERIKAEKERVKKVLAEKAKIKRATGGLNTGAGNTNNNSSSNGSSGNGNGNGNKGSGNRNGKPGLNFNPATGLRTFCGENPPTPPLGMKWVKTAGQCILYAPSGTTTTAVTVGVKVTEWKEVDESFTEAPPKKLSPPGPKGNGNGKGNTQSNTQGNTSTTQATNATQTQGNTTNTTHTHGNTTTADPDLDSDVDMGDPDDDDYDFDDLSFTTPIDRGTPPVPKLRPAADVVEKDGSTGGFMPMKLLPEYLEPSPDADGNYPEWEDVIANTVWRPRRVGEKTLSIGMDQEWGISTEFEFNGGGVDCGRSPYPVLRYIVEYFKHESGCWRKKKVWDHVFGTIFNMPTLPFEGIETPDERRRRMEALYGDFLRDKSPSHRNENYFPLDIRRVDKLDPDTKKRCPGTQLLECGEELVRWPWSNKVEEFTELAGSDPWWVTDEQEELREAPPRKYPPGKQPCGDGTILPTDDRIWKEEVEDYEQYRCRYFVTNLHGGTLIINGIEVKKGRIAGPLPEFAVIETPGNQVSFWFGPGGRDWRAGRDNVTYESQWATLRNMKGWELVGLTAGQVWDVKIRDRLRREHTGEEQIDDCQWAEWKKAEIGSTNECAKTTSPLDVAIWNGPGTNPADGKSTGLPEFSTEEEELQWLLTKANPLKEATPIMQADNLFEPLEDAVWPGPNTSERPDALAQRMAKEKWDETREKILEQQRKCNALNEKAKAAKEREKQQKIDAENRKRKADSDMGAAAKKARLEEAQAEVKAADDKRRTDYLNARNAHEKAMAKQAKARKKLQDDATIAVKLREWETKREAKLTADEKKEQAADEKKREKAADEKKKEKARIRRELFREQEAEALRREMEMDELKKKRAQQGQKQLPDPKYLSEADVLLMADAKKKLEEETRKKRAEAEARRRAAEQKKRKEAELAAAAAKKQEEQAKKDQEAADREARRLQFEEDQKKQAEQKKLDEAAAADKAEALRRRVLFKEKYGMSPTTGLRLNASGNYESGQGLTPPEIPTPPTGLSPPNKTPPKKTPPNGSTQLGVPDLDNMTEEEQTLYAIRMSKLPGSPNKPEDDPDFLNMTHQQRLDHIQKISGKDAKNMSHPEKLDTLRSMIRSLVDPDSYRSAEQRLEQRAYSEGITSLKYVQDRDFHTVEEYLNDQIQNVVDENFPGAGLRQDEPADSPADALLVAQYWMDIATRVGIRRRAELEGVTRQAIVRRKGYDTVDEYVRALQATIRIEDMPPARTFDERGKEIITPERMSKWVPLWKRIEKEFEFEYRIENLPMDPVARKGIKGMIYAEF